VHPGQRRCLTLYVSHDCVIEHNYFHENSGAQIIERSCVNEGTVWTHDNVHRYNLTVGGGAGIFASGGGERSDFYQNVGPRSPMLTA